MEIEVSNGELVDKVSILKIKLQRITSPQKRVNIKKEFDLLYGKMSAFNMTERSDAFQRLLAVNNRLWDIEDQIRIKEAQSEFDQAFIQLARQVYFENDKRSAIKREINIKSGSTLIEEKEYVQYG
jgi:uncharacterized protein DUF6165